MFAYGDGVVADVISASAAGSRDEAAEEEDEFETGKYERFFEQPSDGFAGNGRGAAV